MHKGYKKFLIVCKTRDGVVFFYYFYRVPNVYQLFLSLKNIKIMSTYNLKINGETHSVEADSDTPLLWILRDQLDLLGTKYGCGIGQCGACTVHVNGSPLRSCMLQVSQLQGMDIVTIEGLSKDADHPVQKAWLEHDVPQCGYCQTGQIMTAAALLKNNPNPTDEDIDAAMDGNICRCGTYVRIKQAIKTASKL